MLTQSPKTTFIGISESKSPFCCDFSKTRLTSQKQKLKGNRAQLSSESKRNLTSPKGTSRLRMPKHVPSITEITMQRSKNKQEYSRLTDSFRTIRYKYMPQNVAT